MQPMRKPRSIYKISYNPLKQLARLMEDSKGKSLNKYSPIKNNKSEKNILSHTFKTLVNNTEIYQRGRTHEVRSTF